MENVPTIKSVGKEIYICIKEKLKKCNYGITENIIHMSDYGIPSMRKRLIMVGIHGGRDNILQPLFIKNKNKCNSLNEYLFKNNIDLHTDKKHIYRHPCNYSRRGVFSMDELYPTVRGCMRKMPSTYKFHVNDTSHEKNDILDPTIEIIAIIQTFPRTFKFLKKKNNQLLIGNAVPPLLSIKLCQVLEGYITKNGICNLPRSNINTSI